MKNQNPIFRGIATALVTPPTPPSIYFFPVGAVIDRQKAHGVNAQGI